MKQINKIRELETVQDYYYVTTCGKVISTKKDIKVLKTRVNRYGYEQVDVRTKENNRKTMSVHRLVALSYLPNYDNLPQVNHIDEIKTHNYVQNLEWTTIEENINYGTRNKRSGESRKGDKNPNSKPMEYYVENPTQRTHFKTTCKRQGWKFDDFEEVCSHEKSGGKYKYYYIYRG